MGDSGGGDSGEEVYNGSMELVLVSLSNSYSDEDRFSVDDNKPSSYPVYTIY